MKLIIQNKNKSFLKNLKSAVRISSKDVDKKFDYSLFGETGKFLQGIELLEKSNEYICVVNKDNYFKFLESETDETLETLIFNDDSDIIVKKVIEIKDGKNKPVSILNIIKESLSSLLFKNNELMSAKEKTAIKRFINDDIEYILKKLISKKCFDYIKINNDIIIDEAFALKNDLAIKFSEFLRQFFNEIQDSINWKIIFKSKLSSNQKRIGDILLLLLLNIFKFNKKIGIDE